MADETNEPAQTEGAGQTAKSRPEPVNLAMIEAAQRGLDLDSPQPQPKAKGRAARQPAPEPVPEPEPQPMLIEVRSPDEIEPVEPDAPAPIAASEEPAPENPEQPAPDASPSVEPEGTDLEKLTALADAAAKGRLSPSDEDRATKLMREFIKAGQPTPAIEAMRKLPWILGVRASEQSWPALDEAARASLMEGIVALEGDNAARLRLSLSRSLAKADLPSGLRLASLTCRNLWNSERGALSPEHSKLIGNVFIGRGKPWVLQLPLTDLPAEEASPIASCAVFSAFNVNNPPITQLSVLRYAATLLGSLHENLLTLVARGLARWSGKWQSALRKEVPELPPILAAALKQDRGGGAPDSGAADEAEAPVEEPAELPLPPELEEKLKAATESGDAEQLAAANQEVQTWREANRPAPVEKKEGEGNAPEDGKRGRRQRGRDRDRDRDRNNNEARQERNERNDRNDRPERADRPEKKERPAYVPRDQARENRDSRENEPAPRSGGGGGSFNLSATLKQIESHVQQLRNELATSQAKLRKAETSTRRTDRISLSVEEANLTPDELRRLILQLEARNAELQSQVEELLADSEARAQCMGIETGGQAPEPIIQLRALIALKVQDGYADFIALEKGAPDVIVRQHYRGLLREIFAQLIEQGVPLVGDLPPPPPAPLPPPPPPPVDDSEEEDDEDDELLDPEPIPEDVIEEDEEDDDDDHEGGDGYVAPEADEPVNEEPSSEDEPRPEDQPDEDAPEPTEPTEPLVRDESGEPEPPADTESSAPATEKGPKDTPPAAENT